MWYYENNPAVSIETRRWFIQYACDDKLLDCESWHIIEKILAKTQPIHPGGLIHGVALNLGANTEDALEAGSVCEMYYSGCSVTDDLQDGDTDEYLKDVSYPLRLNAQLQLLCLVSVRLETLTKKYGQTHLATELYRTLCIMLTGQRFEIERNPWTIDTYEKVARYSAGEQFSTYMKIAALSTGEKHPQLYQFGHAIGTLLQVIADLETEDTRFINFSKEEKTTFLAKIIDEVTISVAPLAASIKKQTEELINRCNLANQ
jgi:hypothetical protein